MSKEELISKLKNYFGQKDEVEFAYLFGSYARGDNYKLSDIDVAVMCKKECDTVRILSEISRLLHFEDIDIVDLKKLRNNSLLMDVIKEGIVLKDSQRREYWEVANYHKVLDFFASTRLVYGY